MGKNITGENAISRRNFLAGLTATGALAAAGALAGCAPQASEGSASKSGSDAVRVLFIQATIATLFSFG